MKAKIIFSGLVGMALILGSCGSSNSVVSNGLIQKRKYNKGFFLKSNGQFKTAKGETNEDSKTFAFEKVTDVKETVRPVIAPVNTGVKSVVAQTTVSEVAQNSNLQEKQLAGNERGISSENSKSHFDNFIEKNTQRGVRKIVREKAEKARVAAASGSMSTGEIITLILIIVLIILAFTLLNSLTNGWLGWLVGVILTVVLIVLILRWLGII